MSEETKKDEAPEKELTKGTEKEPASVAQEDKPVDTKIKSGKNRWIFIIITALIILGISGLGIIYAPDRFSSLMKNKFNTQDISIDEDNLSQETLSPFFIPPGPAKDTIRIDLSIVWDGLAAVKFKKKELYIRNMMYDKIYSIAEQNKDLNEKIPYLENEMSSMLRSSLGVQNLVVKIKEIRYF